MNNFALTIKRAMVTSLCFVPGLGFAFNSGSTGADGVFNPTVNTQLELPPSGIFNFTSVNIPAGVTVTFKKNTTNTPVVFLATGDVMIAGTLSVAGSSSAPVGAAGNGNLGDDGVPGMGGPGGFDGGRGGQPDNRRGGAGLGPGGGDGGVVGTGHGSGMAFGGAGAGFSVAGSVNVGVGQGYNASSYGNLSTPGAAYGSSLLLPLIGGSGGGGGAGGTAFAGSGGGGGGGAILIAASGTVTVASTGSITTSGGNSGASDGANAGGTGGSGSGGGIRIVATTIAGNGSIQASAGSVGSRASSSNLNGGKGADGRIRLEAETIARTAATTPAYTTGAPGAVFVAGSPTLTIGSVAGVAAPATPTGNADIVLPANTTNPVTVVFKTTGVPVGNTVKLTVTPANAAPIVIVSPALSGSTDSATASVSVTLPAGPSVMSATTTYTIVAALGDLMSTYAQGERVEKITLAATLGDSSKATLVTVSGKEFPAPAAALALAGING